MILARGKTVIARLRAIGRWRCDTEIQGASPCTVYTRDLRATCAFYSKYLGLICRDEPSAFPAKALLSTKQRAVLWVIAATPSVIRMDDAPSSTQRSCTRARRAKSSVPGCKRLRADRVRRLI